MTERQIALLVCVLEELAREGFDRGELEEAVRGLGKPVAFHDYAKLKSFLIAVYTEQRVRKRATFKPITSAV
jgi:hypothetical protein